MNRRNLRWNRIECRRVLRRTFPALRSNLALEAAACGTHSLRTNLNAHPASPDHAFASRLSRAASVVVGLVPWGERTADTRRFSPIRIARRFAHQPPEKARGAAWGVRTSAFLFAALLLFSHAFTASAQNTADRVLGEPAQQVQLRPGPRDLAAQIQQAADDYRIRVVYLIPANRPGQSDAVDKLQTFATLMQAWFSDHMELMGYGPKTFAYETEPDGTTPLVNIINSSRPDTYFHGGYLDIWGRVLGEVSDSGFPLWRVGEVTLVVAEIHVQEPDGQIRPGSNFVGGAGAHLTGVGMVTGDFLARLTEEFLTDNRPYGGLVIPEFGPYPLVQGVSFPGFEGSTISSVSSSAWGATIHELSHGFRLPHDFRNDSNFNGNLMGNGLRGMRGALFPERYPNDDTRLSSGSALVLNYSRFFNPGQPSADHTSPQVTINSSGSVTPEQGQCGMRFTTRDSGSGLAGALLLRSGQVVADKKLEGAEFAGSISTYDYVPGVSENWALEVFDREGNLSEATVMLTCAAGYNRAPYPYLVITKTRVNAGETITLDAGRSLDPDGDVARMEVEWDLDGDGAFDTDPSTAKTYQTAYAKPGVYRVIARLTDESGDSTLSMPLGIRVEQNVVPVKIDILPGNGKNVLNPNKAGKVWVAVLSSSEFDAGQIKVSSVRFGPGEAKAIRHKLRASKQYRLKDLWVQFSVTHAGIQCGDKTVTLNAATVGGQAITGTDSIVTVGCKKKRKK